MSDIPTSNNDGTNGNGTIRASRVLKGIPTAILYGLLGGVAAKLAITALFLSPTTGGVDTAMLVASVLFVAEWITVSLS